MLRSIYYSAVRAKTLYPLSNLRPPCRHDPCFRAFTSLTGSNQLPRLILAPSALIVAKSATVTPMSFLKLLNADICATPARSVTKFSLKRGKRKSVKAVIKRFKRLHWGIWIRTRSGRQKRLWKKSAARKRRLRQHVFTNASQSWLLDKMVTRFWRRPKFYIDDPYTPYHQRNEYFATTNKVFKV